MKKLRLVSAIFLFIFNMAFLGSGGAGWNGIAAFLVSIILCIICYYTKAKYAWYSSIFIWGIAYYVKYYHGDNGESISNVSFGQYLMEFLGVAIFIGAFVYVAYTAYKDHLKTQEKIEANRRDDVIGCPKCGSRAVHYVESEQCWVCTKCRHSWSDYGSFF